MSRPRTVALLSLLIGVILAIRLLSAFDWDPTAFAAFGEEAIATTEYAEEKLERDVLTRPYQGHDGKYFFVQANDPWVLDPENNAEILDRPTYRSQRMLYPMLAGGFGLFGPTVLIWALIGVNVIALGVGTWAVSAIAVRHGAHPLVGLAFGLNIGLVSEIFIDGAGVVAFALAAVGTWALDEERIATAAALFTGAVLTRQMYALFVGMVAFMWLVRRRRVPWSVSVPPAIAMIAWGVYLHLRIDASPINNQVRELTFIPFSGAFQALTSGNASMIDAVVVLVLLALVVIVSLRSWRSNVYLTWGALGFAILAPFLTVYVWQKSFDISRALAPLITVFVLELFISRNRTSAELSEKLKAA